MQTTLFKHPRLTCRVKTGTCGPAHDPYDYSELTATTPKGTFTWHHGLGEWLAVNGRKLKTPAYKRLTWQAREARQHAWLAKQWLRRVGYAQTQIERIAARLRNRCRQCGCTHFAYQMGMPGETLLICTACSNVVDVYFNEGAIQ